ncbi:hypothetical protein L1987_25283 [Smallanthus sonchifolius]|uniref:Uncharacterized protein n=1 Tax=Smallanthus sonchifolius TaxID=185202 RepID=A0ACB9IND1_9ASTR|nr:hypothetical protein L1987_25283 [Smallanthus sonchifolius]
MIIQISGTLLDNSDIRSSLHRLVWIVYIKPSTFESRRHELIQSHSDLPIEKHAFDYFTHSIFVEVQKEIIKGKFSCYISNIEEVDGMFVYFVSHLDRRNHLTNTFQVTFDRSDFSATCSMQFITCFPPLVFTFSPYLSKLCLLPQEHPDFAKTCNVYGQYQDSRHCKIKQEIRPPSNVLNVPNSEPQELPPNPIINPFPVKTEFILEPTISMDEPPPVTNEDPAFWAEAALLCDYISALRTPSSLFDDDPSFRGESPTTFMTWDNRNPWGDELSQDSNYSLFDDEFSQDEINAIKTISNMFYIC